MSIKYFGLAIMLVSHSAYAAAETGACEPPSQSVELVTLEAAITRASDFDRRPDSAEAAIAAARTERSIARLRPADTVSLEIEDFPGTGLASNIDNLQVTGRFSRVWERGGKREARQALAESGVAVAQTGLALADYEIRHEIENLYAEAVFSEERLQLACERLEIATTLEAAIKRRVDAARDPMLASARAASDRLQAEADARRYAIEARDLRAALASYWGSDAEIRLDPSVMELAPSARAIGPADISTPHLDSLDAEKARSVAKAEVEKASGVPDVTWSVGARKFGIEDDLAIIGGVSIPLGTGVRSEAGVAKARAEAFRFEAESEALRQELVRKAMAYQRASLSALDAIAEIDTILVPEAQRALDLATEGYNRGAFSYLDVFDAQRTLTALRDARLTYLRTHVLNNIELTHLIGEADHREETLP
ncbi:MULTISPECIES: TolC family protein [Hyphomonas]|jgi:cobalt-zinc-cadmium efflux system outer membrane protein|uniref:TolC family protein n=1 Tax=Hyphomonas TaxID=85 RepID=UPI000DBFCEDE|nr:MULTISPECIES: TolC family protein [Hyphomonas]RAN33109.1 hypothetical protein HY11_17115 [Hyphomonas pacifica]|tara:strand:- start:55141 stop:56415 length:1275 start_codon:yes stop_codon:yes gene_type:complete